MGCHLMWHVSWDDEMSLSTQTLDVTLNSKLQKGITYVDF